MTETLVASVTDEQVRAKAQEVIVAARDAMGNELTLMISFMKDLHADLTRDVPAFFEAFNIGTPQKLDPMMDRVNLASGCLEEPELLDSEVLGTWLAKWDGNAANTFHEKFLVTFPLIVDIQATAIAALYNAIRSSQQIMYAARWSAIDIGDQTIAALKNYKKSKKGFWDKALPIINIVGTVAAAAMPVFGAARLATGAAMIATKRLGLLGTGFVLAAQGAPAKTLIQDWNKVEGGSVAKILESMKEKLNKAMEQVQAENVALHENIATDLKLVTRETMLPHRAEAVVEAAAEHDLHSFRQAEIDD